MGLVMAAVDLTINNYYIAFSPSPCFYYTLLLQLDYYRTLKENKSLILQLKPYKNYKKAIRSLNQQGRSTPDPTAAAAVGARP
jgi:hypothetical protein